MFIISVPRQKGEVADLVTEGRRRAAYGPQFCPLLTSCLAASPLCSAFRAQSRLLCPNFPICTPDSRPNSAAANRFQWCALGGEDVEMEGVGARARAYTGSGGGREGRLTTNHHHTLHNVLSLQHYMVYFQWGLAHPSQPFIGPLFCCCMKPKHYRKILNCLIAVL